MSSKFPFLCFSSFSQLKIKQKIVCVIKKVHLKGLNWLISTILLISNESKNSFQNYTLILNKVHNPAFVRYAVVIILSIHADAV